MTLNLAAPLLDPPLWRHFLPNVSVRQLGRLDDDVAEEVRGALSEWTRVPAPNALWKGERGYEF
jgi:hypothetical protein